MSWAEEISGHLVTQGTVETVLGDPPEAQQTKSHVKRICRVQNPDIPQAGRGEAA